MKKLLCMTIFLSSAILLFSQNRADTTLFIEPITGGSSSERAFFDENLEMEISAAGYTLIDDLFDAIYSVSASIAPEDDGFVLSITLSNVTESREMVTQELFYTQVEDSYELLPFLVWQMLANAPFLVSDIPPPPPSRVYNTDSGTDSSTNSGRMTPIVNLVNAVPDDDSWKNKWFYVGAKIGVSPRFYTSTGSVAGTSGFKAQTITFEAGIDVGIQVLDFLTIQLETNFSLDNAEYRNLPDPAATPPGTFKDVMYKTPLVNVPLLVKFVLKPGRSFIVEPYGGAFFNIPVGTATIPPFFGWSLGADFGVKTGMGFVFFDFRYSMDFGATVNSKDNVLKEIEFKRHIVSVTAGYRVGFLNRKQSAGRFRGARF